MIHCELKIDSFLFRFDGPIDLFAKWLEWFFLSWTTYYTREITHISYTPIALKEIQNES